MPHGMDTYSMPFLNYAPYRFGICLYLLSDKEEGCMNSMSCQHIKHLRCVQGIRAIIERNRHTALVMISPAQRRHIEAVTYEG